MVRETRTGALALGPRGDTFSKGVTSGVVFNNSSMLLLQSRPIP